MLGQQSFVQQADIGTMLANQHWTNKGPTSDIIGLPMLANHHNTSIKPTKVQHQISLVCQWWPNIGKPMLALWRFVQWAWNCIGPTVSSHHATMPTFPTLGQCWLAIWEMYVKLAGGEKKHFIFDKFENNFFLYTKAKQSTDSDMVIRT